MCVCVCVCVLFLHTTRLCLMLLYLPIRFNFCNKRWQPQAFHLSSFLTLFFQLTIKLMSTHVLYLRLHPFPIVKATFFPRKIQETKVYQLTTVGYPTSNFVFLCLSALISTHNTFIERDFSQNQWSFPTPRNFRFKQDLLLHIYTRHCMKTSGHPVSSSFGADISFCVTSAG